MAVQLQVHLLQNRIGKKNKQTHHIPPFSPVGALVSWLLQNNTITWHLSLVDPRVRHLNFFTEAELGMMLGLKVN